MPLTYRYIYGTWFAKHGGMLSGGFDFEYYEGQYYKAHEASIKIYIPIEVG
ncbi:GyrI-like domain-containing protein [Paenibacillus sp. 1P07SE]|uniref:GyrI-like domain-containing protein n=1 Tax=Paenibacillus sp. 1P07SE TaxID=3132209 RepID=UPI0039A72C49